MDDTNGSSETYQENLRIKLETQYQIKDDSSDESDEEMCLPLSVIIHTDDVVPVNLTRSNIQEKHVCEHCGKIFESTLLLIRHKKTHLNEKKFNCQECGKCYTSTTRLIKHEKTHDGEKPLVCHLCAKTFKRKCALQDHMVRHYLFSCKLDEII